MINCGTTCYGRIDGANSIDVPSEKIVIEEEMRGCLFFLNACQCNLYSTLILVA